MTDFDLRPLPGSDRPSLGVSAPDEAPSELEATVVLRRAAPGQVGAAPADLAQAVTTFRQAGLEILLADAPSRRVRVKGTAAELGAVFGTTISTAQDPSGSGTFSYRTGGLSVPAAVSGIVTAVLGLDTRPQARALYRVARAETVQTSFTPPQIGRVYQFPEGTDGQGQTIAVIELGGGFGTQDLDSYFGGLGIATPSVTAVGVDGAQNQPGQDPNGADGEVLLDIEVIGGLAPGAAQVVYFAPNTDAGFLDAVSEAIHATPRPCAISISWGQSEDQWTAQARDAMDQAFADAVTLGITVTAAAGDNGSADGTSDGRPHADFPASSPNVLACGGTRLQTDAQGAIVNESVWNAGGGATGGGVSTAFPRPDYQAGAGGPDTGRGLPDVAGNADPATGYQVLIDGNSAVIGGTSAVSPLWAALTARLTQAVGRALPALTPVLYRGASAGTAAPGFHDITSGSNGAYQAGPGWDACTGLGTPNGTALLEVVRSASG